MATWIETETAQEIEDVMVTLRTMAHGPKDRSRVAGREYVALIGSEEIATDDHPLDRTYLSERVRFCTDRSPRFRMF